MNSKTDTEYVHGVYHVIAEDEYPTEDEEEEEEELEDEEDDDKAVSARPRRMSEIRVQNKVKPIPLARSLFIFSPNNR